MYDAERVAEQERALVTDPGALAGHVSDLQCSPAEGVVIVQLRKQGRKSRGLEASQALLEPREHLGEQRLAAWRGVR